MGQNPQTTGFNLVATAIIAWDLADEIPKPSPVQREHDTDEDSDSDEDEDAPTRDYDPVFHCRRAGTVRGLLRNIGQINGELKDQGLGRDTYEPLRRYFCHSELEAYGWDDNDALGLLDPDGREQFSGCWERNPYFRGFYRTHGRPLPPGMAKDAEM